MSQPLTKPQQTVLLSLAWQSIAHGLKTGTPLRVENSTYSAELARPRATFVMLEYQEQPRGCIGNLEPIRPLVEDVSENAFAAAFCDRHFPIVTSAELDELAIHIDLVSALEPLSFSSELDLVSQLRPNVDGLILQDGSHHASFLPSNWQSLPSPMQFVQHLKHKAGLPPAYWSNKITANRFTTQRLSRAD
ncbi:AmmeMemoRadiSam system protein A [Methylomonas methanica]|uniref:AMMECR1 domain protein n=1 Tax=Methylomonas methanica (strain DSM 25384 / MC09) TaxID=857087 RepID=F9ZYY5_METMM|nr:AmmeMemoRadiSam system protein A [Methylomonas methanica]AEF99840.1 AMMECR1 domain protein [Methylomonas methanica MC09]